MKALRNDVQLKTLFFVARIGLIVLFASAIFCVTAFSATPLDEIKAIGANSACGNYPWRNRGKTTRGFAKGHALMFAYALCHQARPEVRLVMQSKTGDGKHDALTHYEGALTRIGLDFEVGGTDTLRATYVLLYGLAQRESSGKYCEGRDLSSDFTSANSAEAGLYQASWGANRLSLEMKNLFDKYENNERGCMLDVFKEGAVCKSSSAKNWGKGIGAEWQRLTKECPAFATEYAAILIRLSGGSRGEFGPLRNMAAEVRPECDLMLKAVQSYVGRNPNVCELLK